MILNMLTDVTALTSHCDKNVDLRGTILVVDLERIDPLKIGIGLYIS